MSSNGSAAVEGAAQALAARARDLLRSLGAPAIAPFLADWPDPPDPANPGHAGASAPPASPALAVLGWVPVVARDPRCFCPSLVAELCRHAPSLAWRQTYSAGDIGAAFLRNYGWTEILGPKSPGGARIACGFLLLGPETLYPRHRHEAEEIYVPLSGTARWRQGDGSWRERLPGSAIHHASDEAHSMHTGAEPLLALYAWRGARLNGKARLES